VAQQGQDAVYNSSNQVTNSPAFIDASMFASSPPPPRNFCTVLNWVLNPVNNIVPAAGAVIDARGFNSTNTSMTCTGTPWNGIANPPPSTILLPATSGATPAPIIISTPWVIPSNTHLIGEGDGIGSSAATTIQVSSPTFNPTAGYILQFGSASGASGISVERLTIDGLGNAVNGIVNPNAGPNSYVDHVTLYQIRGIGLLVENNADGSGPYSNITFNTGSYAGTTATACAQISNVTSATNSSASGGTRGIHGLVCSSNSPDAPAGVLLDSSNNTIEDVKVVGFYDGVLVGSNAPARSNVLVNVSDNTQACNGVCSRAPVNMLKASATNLADSRPRQHLSGWATI